MILAQDRLDDWACRHTVCRAVVDSTAHPAVTVDESKATVVEVAEIPRASRRMKAGSSGHREADLGDNHQSADRRVLD